MNIIKFLRQFRWFNFNFRHNIHRPFTTVVAAAKKVELLLTGNFKILTADASNLPVLPTGGNSQNYFMRHIWQHTLRILAWSFSVSKQRLVFFWIRFYDDTIFFLSNIWLSYFSLKFLFASTEIVQIYWVTVCKWANLFR